MFVAAGGMVEKQPRSAVFHPILLAYTTLLVMSWNGHSVVSIPITEMLPPPDNCGRGGIVRGGQCVVVRLRVMKTVCAPPKEISLVHIPGWMPWDFGWYGLINLYLLQSASELIEFYPLTPTAIELRADTPVCPHSILPIGHCH